MSNCASSAEQETSFLRQSAALNNAVSSGNDKKEKEPVTLAAIGRKAPVALHTFSSQLASATSTFVFYPFDVLKTRFMSQDGTALRQHNGGMYRSIPRSLKLIYNEEGLRTLFRGCPVAVFGAFASWGIYMSLYRFLCNVTECTTYSSRSGISMVASMVSSCLVCPIFLVKSRMQLEEAHRSSNYRTFWSGVRYTAMTSGVRSLWRGLPLQLLLIFPNALSLPTYDALKTLVLRYRWDHHASTELSLVEVCLCSTITKVGILLLSHPLIMMKVRMQDERALQGAVQYRSAWGTARSVLRTAGVRGMYRGFTTALVHSLPRSLTHYFLYEKTLSLLVHRYS